jgi:transposase
MKTPIEKRYIGIDVSKATLDVFVLPDKKYFQVANNQRGFQKLMKQIGSNVSVVLEASGGYEKALVKALSAIDIAVAVVNPRKIRAFAKASGQLAKTDHIDAQIIASFAEKMRPRVSMVNRPAQDKLAAANARESQLNEMIVMEKNRLDKATAEIKKSIARHIKYLEKELDSIRKDIKKHIESDQENKRKNRLLKTIKGVGDAVSASVLANLPELGQLSAKEISALAGLAPYNRDSGTLRGKRTIWGGRPAVRCMLYMSALVATRYNARIKAYYMRLLTIGKRKKVALIACAHKILIIMNAMIANNTDWQDGEGDNLRRAT